MLGAAAAPGGVAFALPPGRRSHLGDIVVSVERAIEQADAGRGGQTGDVRWSPADELRLLVTHGTLHICGWDHAEPAEEEPRMRGPCEQRLLAVGARGGRPSSGTAAEDQAPKPPGGRQRRRATLIPSTRARRGRFGSCQRARATARSTPFGMSRSVREDRRRPGKPGQPVREDPP